MKYLTLREYVNRRNGVPLGANGSLINMLYRSLGASQFSGFWHYWNPIWSYYLGKLIFKPLRHKFSNNASILLTFIISGLLHDFVVSAIYFKVFVLITPWFLLMGFFSIISNTLGIRIKSPVWIYRALLNISYIGISLFIVLTIKNMYV